MLHVPTIHSNILLGTQFYYAPCHDYCEGVHCRENLHEPSDSQTIRRGWGGIMEGEISEKS